MNIDTYLNSGITGKKIPEQPLVTVIVPAYNVELYVEKCIESIIHQSYQNLEIFLVDDGSTDNTPNICDALSVRDERIVVIHQENRGIGGARNAALEQMHGEYLIFVDSDDWIPKYAVEMELNYLVGEKADLVAFKVGYSADGHSFPLYEAICGKMRRLNHKQVCLAYLGVSSVPFKICVWNKMYRSSLWKNRRFSEKINYEDLDIMFWLIHDVEKAVYINEFGYVQLVRPGSVIQSHVKRRDLHLLKITEHMLESANQWYDQEDVLYKWTLYKAAYEEKGLLQRLLDLKNHDYKDSDLEAFEVNVLIKEIQERLNVRLSEMKRNTTFYGKKYSTLFEEVKKLISDEK